MSTSASSTSEACNEKDHLLAEYRVSVRLYGLAVGELTEARPRVTRDLYLRLAMNSAQARQKTEQARLALEKHISKHGC